MQRSHDHTQQMNLATAHAPRAKTLAEALPLPPGRRTNPELIHIAKEKLKQFPSYLILILFLISVAALAMGFLNRQFYLFSSIIYGKMGKSSILKDDWFKSLQEFAVGLSLDQASK